MSEKRNFVVFDVESAEVVSENPDSRFMTVKIQAFSSGKNLHQMFCSEENLMKTAHTIFNTPIIYNIVESVRDFGTHTDPEKSLICGFVVPNSSTFERLEDGRLALFVLASISKRYSPKVVEILKREKGQTKVSVEMELGSFHDIDDGYIEMDDFTYFSVCMLGSMVKEASPGAYLQVLSFAEENKKVKDDYNLEFSNKYADIDFTIPKKIKNNARKSLDEYREKGISTNSVHLAMARFLVNNEVATPEKIKVMAQFFNRKVQYDDITLGFYGHSDGAKWSKDIVSKLEEIDSKHLSYFSREEETEKKEESFVEEKNELEDKVEQMAEEKLPESETKPEEVEMAEKKEEEKEESPKEEEKETPAEEKKEEEKEEKQEAKMSLNENLDMAAYLGFLENATEVSEEMAAKYKGTDGILNHEAIHKMAYDKMCKMAEDLKKAQEDKDVYMSELDNLKKFKKDTEDKQFACELESTFAEVADVLPKEEVTKFREESVNYSIETLAELQNKIKAVAFSYTGKSKKAEDGITRFATSWVNQKSEKDYSHGWVGKAE